MNHLTPKYLKGRINHQFWIFACHPFIYCTHQSAKPALDGGLSDVASSVQIGRQLFGTHDPCSASDCTSNDKEMDFP